MREEQQQKTPLFPPSNLTWRSLGKYVLLWVRLKFAENLKMKEERKDQKRKKGPAVDTGH